MRQSYQVYMSTVPNRASVCCAEMGFVSAFMPSTLQRARLMLLNPSCACSSPWQYGVVHTPRDAQDSAGHRDSPGVDLVFRVMRPLRECTVEYVYTPLWVSSATRAPFAQPGLLL
jgi:hypothetical protein